MSLRPTSNPVPPTSPPAQPEEQSENANLNPDLQNEQEAGQNQEVNLGNQVLINPDTGMPMNQQDIRNQTQSLNRAEQWQRRRQNIIRRLREGVSIHTFYGPMKIPNATHSKVILHLDVKNRNYLTLQAYSKLVDKYIKMEELKLILGKISGIFRGSSTVCCKDIKVLLSASIQCFIIVGCILPLLLNYFYSSDNIGLLYGLLLYFGIILLSVFLCQFA